MSKEPSRSRAASRRSASWTQDPEGVRRSILGAVAELEGASAEIFSMPDLGTRVVLQWRR